MDRDQAVAASEEQGSRNPRPASAAKHGKRIQNRLYSTIRRGGEASKKPANGMNPDATIRVAAVCGDEIRIYGKQRSTGRALEEVFHAAHHGAAVLYAQEHDQLEREFRARNPG